MNNETQFQRHQAFVNADRPHVLMITNHGIHQWQVVPGLPDTGGQNVFVNQFTDTLADFGFKITIVNRGGYEHPLSGDLHRGVDYKNDFERILYIEDGEEAFVRKEDMDEHTPRLTNFLREFLQEEGLPVDLIISHYWDAAKIGVLLNRTLAEPVNHIWVPHSLGTVKKGNMHPDTWADLRVDERIAVERSLLPELDGVAATSARIRQALEEDYHYDEILFLPPCVQVDRYHPRQIGDDHEIWSFLSQHCGLPVEQIRDCQLITEISRTDETKRKDVLIEAFGRVHEQRPDTLLLVSIDETEKALAAKLHKLISEMEIEDHTAVLGYVWDELPDLYAVTDIYCSPSVMEGFGMSVQEAAATKVPVVGSDLIPFVSEYLLGSDVVEMTTREAGGPLQVGEGGIVAPADDIEAFSEALAMLLDDAEMRRNMGQRAYDLTIPYFTWTDMTRRFLEDINVSVSAGAQQA
ncbi:MAG: glycosyltransferase [Candidatus Promineifilaceae bacterium]|nr:glycosyltransferase [Candidatus Promineifilaceae bacterium]